MKLDLGCGQQPREGYLGVDLPAKKVQTDNCARSIVEWEVRPGVVGWDVASGFPWPFETGSVQALYSSHLIEHLPLGNVLCFEQGRDGWFEVGERDVLCHFMDEAWRVAELGAEFVLSWPALVDERSGLPCLCAYQDPTHRRMIPMATMRYFSRQGRRDLGVEQYDVRCNWRIARAAQRAGPDEGVHTFIENVVCLVKEA